MIIFDNMQVLIAKGGWVMYVLLPLSVYVISVIIFKINQLWFGTAANIKFIESVNEELSSGKINEAYNQLDQEKGPVARVMQTAVKCIYLEKYPENVAKEEISRQGMEQLKYYEAQMRGLEMSSNVAPLLGLLGTVSGMIKVFATIQSTGSKVDPAMLAGGIWEAMMTTVAGITVAVIALAAHYIIESKIETLRAAMRDATIRVLVSANRGKPSVKRAQAA